jgi:hypothetical protein
MNQATVCMPWRPQPDRQKAYERVIAFWAHFGYRVITADSQPDQPFHVGQARNNAVKRATTERVIIADADTIPDIAAVEKSLNCDNGITYPFTTYRHIAGHAVGRADLMTAPVEKEYRRSVGGLFVTRRDLYWQLGGMDERFEPRWGYEDNAFHIVAGTLSRVERQAGLVFSFDHAAERDLSENNPNRHRFELYKAAAGNPKMMRELLK